jgi:PEGA domain-containing protein
MIVSPIIHDRALSKWGRALIQFAAVVCLGACYASAQAIGEYAGAVASVGGGASSLGKLLPTRLPIGSLTSSLDNTGAQVEQTPSVHLPLREAEDVVGGNRRALEAKAGKDAAKVMLRSQPDGAWVMIDGKGVGKTPLLLILAPGAYKVEMHITQREISQRQVDLLPKETREVVLTLPARYPSRVEVSWQRH